MPWKDALVWLKERNMVLRVRIVLYPPGEDHIPEYTGPPEFMHLGKDIEFLRGPQTLENTPPQTIPAPPDNQTPKKT